MNLNKKCTVLVTGVGAIIGYGIINSLRKSNYPIRIIGMDIFEDAVGRNWCDDFVVAEPAESEGYLHFLRNLLKTKRIELVIPGIEQDGQRMVAEKHNLDDLKTVFALNNKNLIELCQDKWNFYSKLKVENYTGRIPTFMVSDFDELLSAVGIPAVAKLRCSYASKGMQIIQNRIDFDYYKQKYNDTCVFQPNVGVPEEEYTVGAFGFGDGTCCKPIIFKRTLSGEGATRKAMVVDSVDIEQEVSKLAKIFAPVGPTNFQFRKHMGKYHLLEINPRISSSTSLRCAFGFNESEMCVDYYLFKKRPHNNTIKQGSAVRYIKDCVYYADNL